MEIPWFVESQKEYASRGLVVVGISLDDGWKSVKPWIKEKKVNYPIVIGNEGLGKQYGLVGMPLTALADREGRIADVHQGIVQKTATQEKIRDLLTGVWPVSRDSFVSGATSRRRIACRMKLGAKPARSF